MPGWFLLLLLKMLVHNVRHPNKICVLTSPVKPRSKAIHLESWQTKQTRFLFRVNSTGLRRLIILAKYSSTSHWPPHEIGRVGTAVALLALLFHSLDTVEFHLPHDEPRLRFGSWSFVQIIEEKQSARLCNTWFSYTPQPPLKSPY